MPRVLILCVHRPNRSPSQRFRFEQFLSTLEAAGYDFTFSYMLDAKADKIFYGRGNLLAKSYVVLKGLCTRICQMATWRNYDIVFVQREGLILGTCFLEKFLARRLPLIYDFDDSIWIQNVSEANARFAFLKTTKKIPEMIRAAAIVLAGNNYLAGYARQLNSRVEIVPTTIDTSHYLPRTSPKPVDAPVVIGWSGSFSTIQHFKLAIPHLQALKRVFGNRVEFQIIGDANYFCQELGVQGRPWKADTEVADLQEFDIGIMPLPDDEWSRGKCGLKGLQYMAVGVATLMSPVGVNRDIVQHGVNGFLPDTPENWLSCLCQLVESSELRRRLGEAGRRTVEDGYSVRVWRDKYLQIFASLRG